MRRCCLAPDHKGRHKMQPAHRILWEARSGLPVPPRCVVRPLNGDWTDLSRGNWELITLKVLQRRLAEDKSRAIIREGVTLKPCTDCGNRLPVSMFQERRNVCRECWLEHLRKNSKKRDVHVLKYGCHLVGDTHFHLGKLGDPKTGVAMLYWLDSYFRTLRDHAPTEGSYRRESARLRRYLRESVESWKHLEEKNDGSH